MHIAILKKEMERELAEEIKAAEAAQRRAYAVRGVFVFTGLVMYMHGIFGLLSIGNDYTKEALLGLLVFLAAVAVLSYEDTLANLLALTMGEDISDRGFLCGILDKELTTCMGFKCFINIWGHRKLYFSRLFYYNMNAILIAAARWGIEVTRRAVVDWATDGKRDPRIGVDLLYLVLSNIALISSHLVLTQFGVFGDRETFCDDAEDPEILYMETIVAAKTPKATTVTPVVLPSTSLKESLLGTQQKSSASTLIGKCNWSRVKKEVLTVATFFGITMFWIAIWDLCGTIPAEELVGDDDVVEGDDYYDRHTLGTAANETKLAIMAVCYLLGSLMYLISTGELFTLLKEQNTSTERVSLHIMRLGQF